jgi:hypothetical protein
MLLHYFPQMLRYPWTFEYTSVEQICRDLRAIIFRKTHMLYACLASLSHYAVFFLFQHYLSCIDNNIRYFWSISRAIQF